MNNAITLPRPSVKGIRARDYILPAAIAVACAGAAYAGADTTFDPALKPGLAGAFHYTCDASLKPGGL